jgi:prevent-host-death family protein
MTEVSLSELRNHGGDVVDRAARGEPITITRAGKPVAELRPVQTPTLPAQTLVDRWRLLPSIDPAALREDIDELPDGRL